MARRRSKEYNVIAQLVCTRRGWTSSVGLPLVETTATTKRGAITKARRQWRARGLLKRRCVLHPSAEEI